MKPLYIAIIELATIQQTGSKMLSYIWSDWHKLQLIHVTVATGIFHIHCDILGFFLSYPIGVSVMQRFRGRVTRLENFCLHQHAPKRRLCLTGPPLFNMALRIRRGWNSKWYSNLELNQAPCGIVITQQYICSTIESSRDVGFAAWEMSQWKGYLDYVAWSWLLANLMDVMGSQELGP